MQNGAWKRLRQMADGSESVSRLRNSGYIPGPDDGTRGTTETVVENFPSLGPRDQRVKIYETTGEITQNREAFAPLAATSHKVVFPYTPQINLSHQANYSSVSPTHSNYQYQFYQSSQISEISITGTFTAQTTEEANYVLAVQHFFRTVTKMFYGNSPDAGLPPLVCRLEGHGDMMFPSVPVVIKDFSVNLPPDVDYISGDYIGDNTGRVPVTQDITIVAMPMYSRGQVTNSFTYRKFANGELIGSNGAAGGFI